MGFASYIEAMRGGFRPKLACRIGVRHNAAKSTNRN
jgi:hypothetical protein